MPVSLIDGVAQGATILVVVPMLRAAGVSVGTMSTVGDIDRAVSAAFTMLDLTATLPSVPVAFVVTAWLRAGIAR